VDVPLIARSADGRLTTPSEVDVEENVGLLREIWRAEGRTGGRPPPGSRR
jgi:hypothetical protein